MNIAQFKSPFDNFTKKSVPIPYLGYLNDEQESQQVQVKKLVDQNEFEKKEFDLYKAQKELAPELRNKTLEQKYKDKEEKKKEISDFEKFKEQKIKDAKMQAKIDKYDNAEFYAEQKKMQKILDKKIIEEKKKQQKIDDKILQKQKEKEENDIKYEKAKTEKAKKDFEDLKNQMNRDLGKLKNDRIKKQKELEKLYDDLDKLELRNEFDENKTEIKRELDDNEIKKLKEIDEYNKKKKEEEITKKEEERIKGRKEKFQERKKKINEEQEKIEDDYYDSLLDTVIKDKSDSDLVSEIKSVFPTKKIIKKNESLGSVSVHPYEIIIKIDPNGVQVGNISKVYPVQQNNGYDLIENTVKKFNKLALDNKSVKIALEILKNEKNKDIIMLVKRLNTYGGNYSLENDKDSKK